MHGYVYVVFVYCVLVYMLYTCNCIGESSLTVGMYEWDRLSTNILHYHSPLLVSEVLSEPRAHQFG